MLLSWGGCSPGHRGPDGVPPCILISWRRGSSVTMPQTGKLAQTIGGREMIRTKSQAPRPSTNSGACSFPGAGPHGKMGATYP